ncbi:MAG: ABC transporter permease [Chloroflexota bacterium]|nr:ABC transporter permease [Chloroflexota bacterium]
MNPLSPFTYYRRHKRSALLLIGMVALVTLGVYTMIGVTDSFLEYSLYSIHYLSNLTRVSATDGLDAATTAQIRAHPDVAYAIPENGLEIGVPVPGIPLIFPVLGVTENDLPVVMEECNLRLKQGRLIEPHAAEIVLSAEIAQPLDLHLGDSVSRETDENYYAGFVTEMTVVGILESVPSDTAPDARVAFVSYEYLDSHELYGSRSSSLLVIPREGHKAAVDGFLETLAADADGSSRLDVKTFEGERDILDIAQSASYGFYGFTNFLLAGAATLAVAVINQISTTRRLSELGLLHALGNRKRRLVHRLVLEVAAVVTVGWGVGLACSMVFSMWFNTVTFASRGETLDASRLAPFLFTIPIPLAVVAFVGFGTSRTLNRLDAVAIIERGKLSVEDTEDRKREAGRSSPNPLSFITFYVRHRRRGLLLFTAMALMVLGVALPAFVIATYIDGGVPLIFSYLHRASIVSPVQVNGAVAPETVAQMRAHPASAHVIPVKPLGLIVNASAAIFGDISMPIFAVREDDMRVLMDVYGMHLGDGKLPDHRRNEIVLSRALALNRGLNVGDAVGQPVYDRDSIPTEMVVTGILEPDRAQSRSERVRAFAYAPQWIGFAPHEYVAAHEQYAALPPYFLVVPSPGREVEMETWLEEAIKSPYVAVETFGTTYRFARKIERDMYLFIAVAQVILAGAAAAALAVLQYIGLTQRRDEFGILHAVGHGRIRLVWRALRESASVVSVAWVTGAAVCVVSMLYFQTRVYTPIGLSLNLYNPWPWLFTLPIPVAVVAASAGTVAWTLSRLDPVAVIERR